jgi:DNA polymerase elongation subunit (family B)
MNSYSEAIREMYSTLKREKKVSKTFKAWLKMDKYEGCDSNLYESGVHPVIRFIHETNIQPANWVELDVTEDEYEQSKALYPDIDIFIRDLTLDKVIPIDSDVISPYVIAAFDIECDSSHGDFPQPTKDFKKLAIDIYDTLLNLYEKSTGDLDTLIIQYLKHMVKAGFDDKFRVFLESNNIYINEVYTVDYKEPTEESVNEFTELFDDDSFKKELLDLKKRDSVIKVITKKLNKLVDGEGVKLIVEGDKIIQIGTVFHRYGDTGPYKRHILVIAPQDNLDDEEICDPLDNLDIEVVPCKNELELLLRWTEIIREVDPDYITGYNIFGFDFAYMMDRINVYDKPYRYKFMNMGKINSNNKIVWKNHRSKKCGEKKIKVSNFGTADYNRYIHMDGRIIYDLQKEVEKGHNLESYKLDNVAAHFMRGKIKSIESWKRPKLNGSQFKGRSKLFTTEFGHLKDGDYISLRLHSNIGETYYSDNKKFKVYKVNRDESCLYLKEDYIKFSEVIDDTGRLVSTWDPTKSEYFKIEWCLMKDDVSPQDIFKKHKAGGPTGRAEVAKYCIQDCELCINLTMALDIIPNNIAMANVCCVPQSYIYLRGQGAKIFSLITKVCDSEGVRIPTLARPFHIHDYVKYYQENGRGKTREKIVQDQIDEREYCGLKDWYIDDILDQIESPPPRAGYEGAIVLDPTPGIYLEDPVGVVDYASLYPSSIIEKNISHDTIILDQEYLDKLEPGVDYETIEYDNYKYIEEEGKITICKKIDEDQKKIVCHFKKRNKGEPMGIIPKAVSHLLDQRRATKKRLKNETNEFKKKVLDGLQLSYKLVANSIYGQSGAKTSPIYFNKLAACTTSVGRSRIYDAKDGVELRWWKESKWAVSNGCRAPKVIYGDTDSVFIKWQRYKNDRLLEGKEALQFCIECGKDAGEWVTENMLNPTFVEDHSMGIYKPQDLEYEKTFYPFILISKKRYVADKYEFDINYCSRNSMGIVLKRRDNAPIVKHVFGNVIEKIMIDKDLQKTATWVKETLKDIRDGQFTMRNFIITKSLRGYYKNPTSIAHKVLADRMGERDPGNKPKAGDRIGFAYRVLPEHMLKDKDNVYKSGPRKGLPKEKKVLQGDRIEDPDYIVEQNISLDYEFYITNQIMNPVKQVFDLEMDEKETELIFLK